MTRPVTAKDPETIQAFLVQLSHELRPRMAEDLKAMLEMKQKAPTGYNSDSLEVWDMAHFSNEARHKWCADVDLVSVAQYFRSARHQLIFYLIF